MRELLVYFYFLNPSVVFITCIPFCQLLTNVVLSDVVSFTKLNWIVLQPLVLLITAGASF